MESYNKTNGPVIEKKPEISTEENNWRNGRVWTGLIVIAIGAAWIARRSGLDIPRWITSWEMLLVAIGLFIGIRSNFKNWVWLIPFGIGAVKLFENIAEREFGFYDFNIEKFFWPVVLVIIGLVMIFRPKRKKDDMWSNWTKNNPEWNHASVNPTGEDTIDSVAVFGGIQKNIISKNFRGGSCVSFLGGTELNLSQADMTQPVILDMTQVFGGAKLIVPSNWTIHSTELVSVFGGVEDKRMIAANVDPNKILKLTGTSVFGGLEIKSF